MEACVVGGREGSRKVDGSYRALDTGLRRTKGAEQRAVDFVGWKKRKNAAATSFCRGRWGRAHAFFFARRVQPTVCAQLNLTPISILAERTCKQGRVEFAGPISNSVIDFDRAMGWTVVTPSLPFSACISQPLFCSGFLAAGAQSSWTHMPTMKSSLSIHR